jgi:hypothetical protein
MGNRSGRTPKQELKKQLIDQFAHFWWGAATGALPGVAGWGFAYVGPAASTAGYSLGVLLAVGSIGGWILREKEQGRDGSHLLWEGAPEWLDPALDSAVFLVAIIAGVLGSLLLALGTMD